MLRVEKDIESFSIESRVSTEDEINSSELKQ